MSGFKNMTVMVDFVRNKDIYIYRRKHETKEEKRIKKYT